MTVWQLSLFLVWQLSLLLHIAHAGTLRSKLPMLPGNPLSLLVDGLFHGKHEYFFHAPNTETEELPDGETTMDGGEFVSASSKDCAVLARSNNGICPEPCATHWPNGACILKDYTGKNCLCVDPCTAFDQPAYDDFGHETLLSGCEHCVRHKSRSHLRFEKWTMAFSKYQCGYCGNTCVSGDKNGPSRTVMEECADQYDWTLQDCRRVDLTSEDVAGSETEESYDIYTDQPDPGEGGSTDGGAAGAAAGAAGAAGAAASLMRL